LILIQADSLKGCDAATLMKFIPFYLYKYY